MKREIANKLKEKGFQRKYGTGFIPSLIELIGALDKGFFSLGRDGEGQWRAMIEIPPLKKFQTDIDETPEDSVANLWLLINK